MITFKSSSTQNVLSKALLTNNASSFMALMGSNRCCILADACFLVGSLLLDLLYRNLNHHFYYFHSCFLPLHHNTTHLSCTLHLMSLVGS